MIHRFSDAKGQMTPQSVVESGRNTNSSKLLWLSSLPERMNEDCTVSNNKFSSVTLNELAMEDILLF